MSILLNIFLLFYFLALLGVISLMILYTPGLMKRHKLLHNWNNGQKTLLTVSIHGVFIIIAGLSFLKLNTWVNNYNSDNAPSPSPKQSTSNIAVDQFLQEQSPQLNKAYLRFQAERIQGQKHVRELFPRGRFLKNHYAFLRRIQRRWIQANEKMEKHHQDLSQLLRLAAISSKINHHTSQTHNHEVTQILNEVSQILNSADNDLKKAKNNIAFEIDEQVKIGIALINQPIDYQLQENIKPMGKKNISELTSHLKSNYPISHTYALKMFHHLNEIKKTIQELEDYAKTNRDIKKPIDVFTEEWRDSYQLGFNTLTRFLYIVEIAYVSNSLGMKYTHPELQRLHNIVENKAPLYLNYIQGIQQQTSERYPPIEIFIKHNR